MRSGVIGTPLSFARLGEVSVLAVVDRSMSLLPTPASASTGSGGSDEDALAALAARAAMRNDADRKSVSWMKATSASAMPESADGSSTSSAPRPSSRSWSTGVVGSPSELSSAPRYDEPDEPTDRDDPERCSDASAADESGVSSDGAESPDSSANGTDPSRSGTPGKRWTNVASAGDTDAADASSLYWRARSIGG